MKKSFLLGSAVLVFACSAYAQQLGVYRGRTSQAMDIQFIVTNPGQLCVDQVSFAVRLTCPTGALTFWGAGFGGCNPIQDDGSFTVTLPPVDGSIPTYVVSGQFTSDTSAEGGISFQASHLRVVPDEPLDAQLCDSGDVTWTANHTAEANEPIRFEGNQVVTGKSGTQVTLQ